MGIIIGILIGLCFGSACEIIAFNLLKAKEKRKWKEEERIRTLEHELSFLNDKCDRTHKACCILSDIVKENYKTEEKEECETSKHTVSEIDKINARNMGHQINRREIEEMVNSIHPVLYPQTCGELYASSLYPQTCSIISQQECSVEDLTLRNMALMQNCCSVSAEEAQRRILSAMVNGWKLPDDPD